MRGRVRVWTAVSAALWAPLAALVFPQAAAAHAFGGGRTDLPIPPWLFAWAASVVLIISFFALSVLWKNPRFEREDWHPWGGNLSRYLINPVTEVIAGAVGVGLLGFAIWTGLQGTEAPDRNFSLTFIFVTCWLGFPVFSILLGDIFPPFSPWRAIGRVIGGTFERLVGQRPLHLRYPERLGRWPAAAGLVAFVWFELIYGAAGGISVGLTPYSAGVAALVYTIYTLVMMAIFGTEEWSQRGETFAVYFNMFSQLSTFEVRDGQIGRRRAFSGAAHWATVPGSIALVVASIATTSFDGAQEGVYKSAITSTFNKLVDAGVGLVTALRLDQSFYMALTLIGVAALFLIGVQGMRTVRRAPPAPKLRQGFVHTLIPIAFAYLIAHYFSFFVFQEQAQFTYLLSDPLGVGSNVFGTATSGIDYGLLSAKAVWYVQVAALVVGHVCGLTMAHDRAIAYWDDYKLASRSQVWMLAVMVGFTSFGLYLLSQANQ